MIDIHNHLLPGIDDGAIDLAESLKMCRIAAEDGVKIIAATPHSFDGDHVTAPEVVRNAVSNLNGHLKQQGLDLQIVPGMEIRVVPEFPDLLSTGNLMPLNEGRFLLLEFQHAHAPAGFGRLISMLKEKNYGIILGHPEKNFRIQQDLQYLPNLMKSLSMWDLILQVSADSLTGDAGKAAYKTARFLMESDLVHVIATDAHSSLERPPLLSPAVAEASKIVGEDRANQMVNDIPLAILNGIGFPKLEQFAPPKRWWQIFSR